MTKGSDRPTTPGTPARERPALPDIPPPRAISEEAAAEKALEPDAVAPAEALTVEAAPAKLVEAVAVGGQAPGHSHAGGEGRMTAEVYAAARGLVKEGRSAIFLHHVAQDGGPTQRTTKEWEAALAAAWARPVK